MVLCRKSQSTRCNFIYSLPSPNFCKVNIPTDKYRMYPILIQEPVEPEPTPHSPLLGRGPLIINNLHSTGNNIQFRLIGLSKHALQPLPSTLPNHLGVVAIAPLGPPIEQHQLKPPIQVHHPTQAGLGRQRQIQFFNVDLSHQFFDWVVAARVVHVVVVVVP
jgi:hypothetical protein